MRASGTPAASTAMNTASITPMPAGRCTIALATAASNSVPATSGHGCAVPSKKNSMVAISALGVQVLTLRPAIGQVLGFAADARGVVVDRVDTGAAGSAAGLTSGDLIVAVNGTAVRNAAEFERLLVDAQKKDTIELELLDTAGQRSRLTTKWGR